MTQLKQEKFALTDQLQEVQEHSNQLDIDNNQLTIKMKQLKDLLEQKEQTITQIRQKMITDKENEDHDNTTGYFHHLFFSPSYFLLIYFLFRNERYAIICNRK